MVRIEKCQMPLSALKMLCLFYKIYADFILDILKDLEYPKREKRVTVRLLVFPMNDIIF